VKKKNNNQESRILVCTDNPVIKDKFIRKYLNTECRCNFTESHYEAFEMVMLSIHYGKPYDAVLIDRENRSFSLTDFVIFIEGALEKSASELKYVFDRANEKKYSIVNLDDSSELKIMSCELSGILPQILNREKVALACG